MSDKWISVKDRLPDSEVKVLAAFKNRLGYRRRIIGFHVPARTVTCDDFYSFDAEYEGDYDEENDTYWVKEGWHEAIENWGDLASVEVCEGVIDYWMLLPPPPEADHE